MTTRTESFSPTIGPTITLIREWGQRLRFSVPTPYRGTRTALMAQKRAPTRHPLSLPPSGPPGLCLVEAVGSQRRGQLSGTCPEAESGLSKRPPSLWTRSWGVHGQGRGMGNWGSGPNQREEPEVAGGGAVLGLGAGFTRQPTPPAR